MSTFAHPYTDIDNGRILVDCFQCGYNYETHKRYLSEDRTEVWWLCKSCKAKPTNRCWYGDDFCTPWQGEFDLDVMMCLDEKGQPYMVGPRKCGHWDCVRETHQLVRSIGSEQIPHTGETSESWRRVTVTR